ncbi:hypothetical protein D3C86_1604720 [compost metagenome]
MLQCGLADAENGGDVDIEGHHPFVVGDVFEVFVGHLERGVVDQHIDPAEAFDRLVHQGLAVRFLRQVAGQQQALPAGLLDPARGFLRVFMFVEVGHHDIRAFTGEGNGDGATDAAVGAGDQGDLALQPARTFVTLLAAVRVGVHFLLGTGDRLALFGEGWFWIVIHGESPISRQKSQRVDPGVLP